MERKSMEIEEVRDIPALQQWVKEHALRVGHLAGEGDAQNENRGAGPYLWKWAEVEGCMNKVTELVSLKDAIRRNIGLVNPTAGGVPRLSLGLQVVLPGEQAPSHRHSAAAIRFVVRGTDNAYNLGEGEPMPFEEGDLITNPHLTFHGHVNHGDGPVMWLDGLDGRFAGLAHLFRENYEGQEPLRLERLAASNKLMGHVRPNSIKPTQQPPPFRYPWAETQAALMALRENEEDPDPHDGYLVTFLNPVTAGPTLPTVACEMQLLPPGFQGKPHRHNSQVVYHVFRGEGATVVDGQRFEWGQGDFLDIPHWAEHHHENRSGQDALLFSFTDWPAMKALGLYETQESHAEKGLPASQR
jgi:gentisate 1,2-dioxygenase